MLHHLKLNNFRKHVDLDIDFSRGLNVLRGSNESGKSTTLESILYALYGSRALRTTLAETVTWGQPESALKVELTLSISGKEYTFSRSKGGATVYVAGQVHTTGQNEVTALATELLGADAKTAALLMMASQSDLHGALAEGPAAVSALIGKLADFSIIDRLVESAQANLLLGNAAPFEQRLADAQNALVVLQANTPDTSMLAHLENQALDLAGNLQIQEHAVSQKQALATAAASALSAGQRQHQEFKHAEGLLQGAQRTLDQVVADWHTAGAQATSGPTQKQIDEALARVSHAENADVLVKMHALVESLPAYPAVFWDEGRASFDVALSEAAQAAADALAAVNAKASEAKTCRARKITTGKCPTCGSAARSDEHVATINAGVEAEAVALDVELEALRATWADSQTSLTDLRAVLNMAAPFLVVEAKLANLDLPVVVDTKVFPPSISWVGEIPGAADVKAAADALANLRARSRAAAQAEGRAAQLGERETALRSEIQELTEKTLKIERGLPDLDTLGASQVECSRDLGAALLTLQETRQALATADAQVQQIKLGAVQHEARVVALQATTQQLEKDVADLAFNNNLVKKLRALKPAITDNLWGIVLASVGTFFSQIRGETSIVSKDTNGFKVNGHAVESLSGSTLDALAIAIRVSLTKTFIPHAPFITLDEPAHGADAERTGNILGFLAGAGFDQTLLASHDPLSESVAENVINLGD